jgi:hypothetical protein
MQQLADHGLGGAVEEKVDAAWRSHELFYTG